MESGGETSCDAVMLGEMCCTINIYIYIYICIGWDGSGGVGGK